MVCNMLDDDTKISSSRLDLNLLRVFDAVYQARSILKASKRLHLSQSAVSHALTRLRENVGDDLFIRTAKGMQPSPRAVEMAGPIHEALRAIYHTLDLDSFEPETSPRTFVIAANDYVTSVLVAKLVARIGRIASGINLVIRPATRLDLAEQVDIGRIDLAIGSFRSVPEQLMSTELGAESEVLLMRRGHSLSTTYPIRLESLADYPLAAVSVGGQEEGAVEGYISERGLARQSEMFGRRYLEEALSTVGRVPDYKLLLPHFLALPDVLCKTEMIALVPASLACSLCNTFDLEQHPLPYKAPPLVLQAIWHRRNCQESGHAWLREQLQEVVQCSLYSAENRAIASLFEG